MAVLDQLLGVYRVGLGLLDGLELLLRLEDGRGLKEKFCFSLVATLNSVVKSLGQIIFDPKIRP